MPRASHVIAALALLATAATAVAQPAGGNRNYVFRSPGSNGAGCLPIDGLEVTVEVTEESDAKKILRLIDALDDHDDAQVGRLLVERRAGARERITVRVTPH